MLKPRSPVARPLTPCLWLGSIAAVGFLLSGFAGCQGPDTFLRKPGSGAGGGSHGSGGSSFGTGGHGTGGTFGTGGSNGAGGFGVGGRTGAGGSLGTGGSFGVGGARDGGADATGAGGAVVDASTDLTSNGTGPCMGICAPATEFVSAPNYNSPAFLQSVAACYETTSRLQGGGCSNCGGRAVFVNGTPGGTNFPSPMPAAVRGGFCIQVSAGTDGGAVDYASFYTFSF